jgi:hypothetical protein
VVPDLWEDEPSHVGLPGLKAVGRPRNTAADIAKRDGEDVINIKDLDVIGCVETRRTPHPLQYREG